MDKISETLYWEPGDDCDRLDLSVNIYYEESKPKIYLGRASSVIVFPLDQLDEFIEFINKARNLEPK